ncbi:MAG: phage neck terminator protein [Cetobacterium sp.]
MLLTNPISTINLRNFLIEIFQNVIIENNIFIGIQTDGSYPSTNSNYIVILHLNSENTGSTNDEFVINDEPNLDTYLMNAISKDTIQVDFYGNNSLSYSKNFENILNSQYGNEIMKKYNIGCETTQPILNLSGINIGDNAEHRFSITIDVLYYVENRIENIEAFTDIDLNIVNVDSIKEE